MSILRACAVLLLCAAPLFADPGSLPKSSALAEDKLRVWLDQDPAVRAKLGQVQAAAVVPAPEADPDLKDAVADRPVQDARQELLARLPGMKAPQSQGCANAADCGVPPLAVDVAPGESVEHAIRAMVRPWIWLAEQSGVRLAVGRAADSQSGQVLVMKLKALGPAGVGLNISARPEGGFRLWFDRGLELAEIYYRERAAIMSRQP